MHSSNIAVAATPECFGMELILGGNGRLLCHHGEVLQRLAVAGVDKTVRVAAWTVVALAGCEALFAAVVEATGRAVCDVDYLAVLLMCVVSDSAANIESAVHDFVQSVILCAHPRDALATLEVGHGGFFNLVEIYYHNRYCCLTFQAPSTSPM